MLLSILPEKEPLGFARPLGGGGQRKRSLNDPGGLLGALAILS